MERKIQHITMYVLREKFITVNDYIRKEKQS